MALTNATTPPTETATVTNRKAIEHLVADINALPLEPQPDPCSESDNEHATLVFDERPRASVQIYVWPWCGSKAINIQIGDSSDWRKLPASSLLLSDIASDMSFDHHSDARS
jgi:hypothetical protein